MKDPMTPEIARKMLHEAGLITHIGDQANAYRQIIANLCAAGYSEEAWQMILTEPGYNRGSELWAFFATADMDLSNCERRLAGLYDAKEKSNALAAFFGANFERFPNMLDDPAFRKMADGLMQSDPEALTKIVGLGLRQKYDRAKTSEEKEKVNQAILDMYSRKLVSDEVFSSMIIRNSSDKKGFDLWPWISNSSMGVSGTEEMESNVRASVIQDMVFTDASKALTQISASRGQAANHDLYLGLTEWAEHNPKAANDWYLNQRSKLTEAQQDSAARSFALLALGYKELQGAESWANQIQDTELRDSILEKIRSQNN